ncbi:DUF1992 domain-containing protein [Lentzea sp. NBRC 105346]|uniref:DnaJ family domain-containing protein n=1 Tax=Lentzea sp. NBRC 105346 TaxID=3032205 RepID=UPI0024A45637|nr:DnaJ family domain-containing protein [Lentzea sp. NBRC 105346]GLZ33736.1 DUF1992 domain-containing protein [Lentzea sp. NBRC 105346]
MTERKPPGVSFESWVDRQIREAQERGEFDNLAGSGKPLPVEPYDEDWWIKKKVREEEGTVLPASLQLRREAFDARALAVAASSDDEARRILSAINARIVEALRKPLSGPPLNLMPFDVEAVLRERQAGS